MNSPRQIFQTESRLRWKAFQWISRIILFLLALTIPVVWIAVALHIDPQLPSLSLKNFSKSAEIIPKGLTSREVKKYKGFSAFIKKDRQQNAFLVAREKTKPPIQKIRAAFYVNWDPQAFFSLQSHISSLNTVIPEWFFIDSTTGKIINRIQEDTSSFKLMKQYNVKILPLLTNVDPHGDKGVFDERILHEIFFNTAKKQQLINDIFHYLQQYKLQGVNIDFEELKIF